MYVCYAGGTLARREKKVQDHVCYDLDVWMYYVGLYDYVLEVSRHGVFWGTALV